MSTEKSTEKSTDATGTRWLNDAEQAMWRDHLRANALLDEMLDDDLKRHGLSLSEYDILAWLSEAPGGRLRMSQLADRCVQSRSRLTHTATRLEKSGWVRREACLSDKRGVELVMTDEGMARMEGIARVHVRGVREYFVDIFTPDEIDTLGRLYARLRTHLETVETT